MMSAAKNEASLRRYRELFDLAPNPYLATDVDGRIAEANRSAEKLLGCPRRNLAGTPLAAFVAASHEEGFRARLASLRRGRTVRIQDWHLPLVIRGDTVLDTEVSVAPAAGGNDGQASTLLWLLRDVTERKRAEVQARERELSLQRACGELERTLIHARVILGSTVDGPVTIDENGLETAPAIVLELGVDGSIVHFNRYMEELSGYRLTEVSGRDWLSTFSPDADGALGREAFARVLRAGGTARVTHPMATRDGDEWEIEWRHTPLLNAAGETTGVLVVGLPLSGSYTPVGDHCSGARTRIRVPARKR